MPTSLARCSNWIEVNVCLPRKRKRGREQAAVGAVQASRGVAAAPQAPSRGRASQSSGLCTSTNGTRAEEQTPRLLASDETLQKPRPSVRTESNAGMAKGVERSVWCSTVFLRSTFSPFPSPSPSLSLPFRLPSRLKFFGVPPFDDEIPNTTSSFLLRRSSLASMKTVP
ncbi:LOW QUALITY PROTEIN: hypothetical protein RTBOTA2_003824 [Rhodotorula toruloides]|nr:LOW QUALITY PROTEIN: hypothetical protein RTBOTA2_003824 [Rhodotorula toruloides]